jgi:hypothetical protein
MNLYCSDPNPVPLLPFYGFLRQKQDCSHLLFLPYPPCAAFSAFFANLLSGLQFLNTSYSWQNVAMLCFDWQKLKAAPFIHAGVVFLATPCNKQPFASFLMLTQGFHLLALVLLFVVTPWRTNSLLHPFNAHSHSIDTFLSD